MTRREEITKKALELDTTNDIATFVVAAQWADKTMIEKACEWLKDRFYNSDKYLFENPDGGYRKAYDVCCSFESIQEMVNDFCKAMEE